MKTGFLVSVIIQEEWGLCPDSKHWFMALHCTEQTWHCFIERQIHSWAEVSPCDVCEALHRPYWVRMTKIVLFLRFLFWTLSGKETTCTGQRDFYCFCLSMDRFHGCYSLCMQRQSNRPLHLGQPRSLSRMQLQSLIFWKQITGSRWIPSSFSVLGMSRIRGRSRWWWYTRHLLFCGSCSDCDQPQAFGLPLGGCSKSWQLGCSFCVPVSFLVNSA